MPLLEVGLGNALGATLLAVAALLCCWPGLPFRWEAATLVAGLNFTLITTIGAIDLLGEVTGGGSFEELLPFTEEMDVFDVRCRFVTLEKLIQLKKAAGRPRDFDALAELEAILEERRRSSS